MKKEYQSPEAEEMPWITAGDILDNGQSVEPTIEEEEALL